MIYSPISSPIRSAVSSLFANRGGFVPSRLFAAGEQGAWYDPSDWSTLYQDSAGTTPVTAVEQPVGLILDKSKGLVLGPELVTNGDFSNGTTGWVATNSIISIVDGRLNVENTGGSSAGYAYQQIPTVVGNRYSCSVEVTTVSGSTAAVSAGTTSSSVNLFTQSSIGNGVFRFTFVATTSASFILLQPWTNALGRTTRFDNISVRELPGNHAYQTTSTSRPVLRQDAGGRYYLSFDGVDDFLVTNSIDFTSTDKMTVFAGVRKLSDAAAGALAELSANVNTNNGTFSVFNGDGSGRAWSYVTRGTATNAVGDVTGAPDTAVIVGISDIGAPRTQIRRNGVVGGVGNQTLTLGTGNFGNYPLYIGRRGGTSLPFTGYLYSLIVRGAQTSAAQVSQTETWVNGRTGAY